MAVAAGDGGRAGAAPVRLRPVRREDIPMMERLALDEEADPASFSRFGFPEPGALERRFEQGGMLAADRGRLVVETADGAVAGFVSYNTVMYGPGQASRAFNVGILLARGQRGRGHGSAAQRLLADYLFDHTPVERVEASTDADNHAERRALEKAGFTCEGIARHAQFRGGAWRDLAVYSRLRSDSRPPRPPPRPPPR